MNKDKPLCKTCGSLTHYTTFCFFTKKKAIRKMGKQAIRWRSERRVWIEKHPPNKDGFWYCHYCGVRLVEDKHNMDYQRGRARWLTVDHMKPRSSNPKLRYKDDNLVPCCYADNILKGSMEYNRFLERYYPEKLTENEGSPIS